MTPKLEGNGGEAPKPTTALPTALFRDMTAGVEVGYAELDEMSGAPEASRNPVTTRRSPDPATLPAPTADETGRFRVRTATLANIHTTVSPTMISTVGQMKLCDRMLA